jgi:pimeloyl-ACP methyl ester carboxylesterase
LLSTVQTFDVLRCGPRWYLAQLKLAMSYPLEDRLPLAGQPVLVLRGSRDVVAGAAWSDRLARTAQHGKAGTIDGAPHAAHHSAAGTVAAAITSFLVRR